MRRIILLAALAVCSPACAGGGVVSNRQYSVGQSVVVTAKSDGSFHVR